MGGAFVKRAKTRAEIEALAELEQKNYIDSLVDQENNSNSTLHKPATYSSYEEQQEIFGTEFNNHIDLKNITRRGSNDDNINGGTEISNTCDQYSSAAADIIGIRMNNNHNRSSKEMDSSYILHPISDSMDDSTDTFAMINHQKQRQNIGDNEVVSTLFLYNRAMD